MTVRTTRLRRIPSPLRASALAAVTALGTGIAAAEPNPFYFRATETITHDDNIERVNDARAISDWLSATNLAAGIDQAYGRQKFKAEIGGTHNAYRDTSRLDNNGYNVFGDWLWEAGDRWSGEARLGSSRALANFDESGVVRSQDANLEKVNSGLFKARYGLVSLWAIEGGVDAYTVRYSQPEFQDRDRDSGAVNLGVLYRPRETTQFGAGYRRTKGEYKHTFLPASGTIGKDEYHRDDIDLTTRLDLSGINTISARLSFTDEKHDGDPTRDYSGLTGDATWEYRITGKTTFTTQIARETGAATIFDIGGVGGYISDARVSTRIGFGAKWEATAKITVIGRLGYSHDQYPTVVSTAGQPSSVTGGDDGNSTFYGLGARYELNRAVAFECAASHRKRDTSRFIDGIPYGYTATTYGCLAQLTLQ
ncbi:MAG TPA: outer membrane beta-barrel protein [Burkholderiaceae bacterium]|jgi:hypothetical protein|nr:outer membrane beta-barrel protein [Burkholderiaceae bacterium]